MIAWTLTEGVEHPDVPGELYWEVNGEADNDNSPHQDPHDPRHFPTRLAALTFLLEHKMKRGDTLHHAGADTGRILRVGYVRVGDAIEFDVGATQLPDPETLLEWIDQTMKAGDTLVYLPIGDVIKTDHL